MKRLIIVTVFLVSGVGLFAQTKLIVGRKDGTKDSVALNSISQIKFSSSGINQPSLLEVQQILDMSAERFLEFADSTTGDPRKALILTRNWVQALPGVQSVVAIDSLHLDIVLKSGLQTGFFYSELDDDGIPIFRGGGKGSAQAGISFENLSKNTITNNKVLIYAPTWTEFELENSVPKTVSKLTNSGLDLVVTVLKDEVCAPDITKTFKDYGLVIMNTHGLHDGFMCGTIIDVAKDIRTDTAYKNAVIKQVGQDIYDGIIKKDYKIVSITEIPTQFPNWQKRKDLKRIESVFVTTQYIKTLDPMPNTVLFGNMCYSGFSVADPTLNIQYPIKTAFMDKSPISYYCYAFSNGRSSPVTDTFSKQMEDSLVSRLVKDLDSTGIANLSKKNRSEFKDTRLMRVQGYNNVTLFFKHFGADDYSYQKCGDTLTDARDRQKYTTVCIGGKKWMAQNLNYNAPGSITYDNNDANGAVYGRLYDFRTIMQGSQPTNANPSKIKGICPNGWHVPSSEEFLTLFDAVGFDTAGGALKATTLWTAPNTGATNKSGFKGLPGGVTSNIGSPGSSMNLGLMAYFATTTTENAQWVLWNLVYDSQEIQGTNLPLENWGVSCRCVKD